MLPYCYFGAASLIALACAGTALADEAADAGADEAADTRIEEIVVSGKYLSLDKLDSVKTPTPIIDVPQSLSIISSDQIERQFFTSLGDVLRYTPGLSISQGEGHRDAIVIRGITSTADFFIDGLRDDVQYFRPLYNLERVEILRGSNALLFGRGGGGGVINRVTKRPEFGERFVGFSSSINTFGSYNIAGDANFAVSEDAAIRMNAFYEELDNHRDFFGGERFAINPTASFKVTPDTNVLFSYEYVDDDRVVDRGVPSQTVVGGPNVPLKGFDKTFFGSPDGNRTTLQAHIAKARVDHTFSDALRGNLTVQYADYDKLYQNLFASGAVTVANGAPLQVRLDGYQDFTDRQNFIIQTNFVSEFKTGPVGHTVLFGGEFGDQDTKNSRNDNVFADNGSDQITIAFTDPLNIPAFSFSNFVRDRESSVQFVSVYLQDQIDVTDWLKLVAGVRYDRFDIDVLDIMEQNDGDAQDGNFSRVDEKFTPRLGAILKPVENISVYASYSETFLPRSGDQFLTLDLDTESTRPQSFENKEVGVKWDIRPDLSVTAAVFDLDRSSFTAVDPNDPGQIIIIEGSQTQGFELQLSGYLTESWNIVAGYSYLDGKVRQVDGGGNNGNKTRQTPENMVSVWNNIAITDKLGVGFGATYQDSFFVQEDNSVKTPDFIRVDAAIYYTLNDNLRLQVNVENLLDESYVPDAHSNSNISTGAPINARFSLIGRF